MSPFRILLSAALIVVVSGCDSRTVNPFEKNVKPYSVYGYLDLDQNPNYIRVRQLDKPYLEGQFDSLDATVYLENLSTGVVTELQDTVINFNGFITNNFIVRETMTPETGYKLTVRRSDGAEVTSVARIPRITEYHQQPAALMNCENPIEFVYRNVVYPEYVRMQVGVRYRGAFHWATVGRVDILRHRVAQNEMFLNLNTRQLLVEIFPPSAIDNPSINPRSLFPTVNCTMLDEAVIYIRYVHFGPEWAAVRLATDPLESPSIDGGLGFFGGLRQDTATYTFLR